MSDAPDYRPTVFLPKTTFSMKANLATKEPNTLKNWQETKLYDRIRHKSKGRPKFILHFGPPYANGHIHMGHTLSEVLKDIVNKVYQMRGYDAPMVPGWDCHGLPIEWKVEESYRKEGKRREEVDVIEFRQRCRDFANEWMPVQSEEFQRLGIVADWHKPYVTMDYETEARIIEDLGFFLMNDYLYRGFKPVLWSVVEKTALAEAEVEYQDKESDAIDVAFPVRESNVPELQGASLVIWTTTPWTLPGNRGLAINREETYAVVDVELSEFTKRVVIANPLVDDFIERVSPKSAKVMGHLSGADLEGTVCDHPLKALGFDFAVPVHHGAHVTSDAGTGIVHIGPAHGLEDFQFAREYELEIPVRTVGPDGVYHESTPAFAGMHIFKVNPHIIDALAAQQNLLAQAKITHSYPHSWRSKAPLIYRATEQWFLNLAHNDLRQKALKALDQVNWVPEQGYNRIRSMIENRPDWCLSRQRVWGTPIAIFVNVATGEPLRDPEVHSRVVDAVREQGADAWFKLPKEHFLGSAYNPADYEKVMDVLDVWFDSGCTQSFVLKDRNELDWPADVYLEGSDQHRGWFQASLLIGCALNDGQPPFKTVVTHGFVLDEQGYKMSKSQGNVISPQQIMAKNGADLLRLWVVTSDYTEDLKIGKDILKHLEDLYRRFRNTLRYLLGSLDQFELSEKVEAEDLPELERWVLHRLYDLNQQLEQASQTFNFQEFYYQLHHFCAVDLSAFYFDIRKDSLYCDAKDSFVRRSTRTVMKHILMCLTHWLAPVLSYTTDEAWHTYQKDTSESIHNELFPKIPEAWHDSALAEKWEVIRDIRRVITGALEIERNAKTIGSSLQAHVAVYLPSAMANTLKNIDLAELAIVSDVEVLVAQPPAQAFTLDEVANVGAVVNVATGQKCPRCWKVFSRNEAESSATFQPGLCPRCDDVLTKDYPDFTT